MIIGRTKFNAERNCKNALSKKQYYYISHLARKFLIDNNITKLPLYLNKIIKQNKWKTVTYTKLRQLNIIPFNNIIKKNMGFTQLNKNEYTIFYDDEQPVSVQRFTICHEIGHIMLNHFNVPIENREQEANMFAARILMPICVLYECKVSSVKEIEFLCNVSKISAKYRFNRLQILRKRQAFYSDQNEIIVKKQFQPFITQYLSQ